MFYVRAHAHGTHHARGADCYRPLISAAAIPAIRCAPSLGAAASAAAAEPGGADSKALFRISLSSQIGHSGKVKRWLWL